MNRMPIYLDYMSTTPIDPRVMKKMINFLHVDGIYGNSNSKTHIYGKMAYRAIEFARRQISTAIHAFPHEIIFTSGATESNNIAILGASRFYKNKGRHIITSSIEHKSVINSCKQLEKEGFKVDYIKPKQDGILNINSIKEKITQETILVSIMHVNNEIGVIQDIMSIGNILQNMGIIFHVDAAQSAGKLEINLQKLHVNLMSFSGHKIYGPKGIGALYIKSSPKIHLQPQNFGGGQENKLRNGTLPTHQIVGMGEAFFLSEINRIKEQQYLLQLKNTLWEGIKNIPGIHLNGNKNKCIPGNINISFVGIQRDSILLALRNLAISTASSCLSPELEFSYVLQELGLAREIYSSAIRISFGRFTKYHHIKKAIKTICYHINRLQKISPIQ